MVNVAHIAVVTPRRCGLYETTRELVAALRAQGVDSRIYDPTRAKNKLHPDADEDRGAPFADLEWAKTADILINHSGLGSDLEATDQPVIHVAHGRPRSSFLSEFKGSTPIYSYHYHKNRDPRWRAVVTFWPEHEPYLRVMWPDKPIHVVRPPVDLEAWNPKGPTHYNFGGLAGKVNVVCTDAWRDDVDPFVAVNAFALFAREYEGARLHIYGKPKNLRGWAPLLKTIQNDGNLGEVRPWVVKGLDNVYRAADCLLTPHTIDVRSRREAMACGCPVICTVSPIGGKCELNHHFAESSCDRKLERGAARADAERDYNPANTARDFMAAVESCLPVEAV